MAIIFTLERFLKAFANEKVYLNLKLNIVELAMAVGTNRTYISNYINQQLHTTFYEYVNKWRLTEIVIVGIKKSLFVLFLFK